LRLLRYTDVHWRADAPWHARCAGWSPQQRLRSEASTPNNPQRTPTDLTSWSISRLHPCRWRGAWCSCRHLLSPR